MRRQLLGVVVTLGCAAAACGGGGEGADAERRQGSTTSSSVEDLSEALQAWTGDACQLLSEEDAATLGVTVGPRELRLYDGTRSGCYWVTSTGIQFGWVPDPPQNVREEGTREPGAEEIEVAGYSASQVTTEDGCTQDVVVSPDGRYFRTLVTRVEQPPGVEPSPLCEIANSISEVVVEGLESLA